MSNEARAWVMDGDGEDGGDEHGAVERISSFRRPGLADACRHRGLAGEEPEDVQRRGGRGHLGVLRAGADSACSACSACSDSGPTTKAINFWVFSFFQAA